MFKRISALLLCVVMLVGMLPVSAFAEETAAPEITEPATQPPETAAPTEEVSAPVQTEAPAQVTVPATAAPTQAPETVPATEPAVTESLATEPAVTEPAATEGPTAPAATVPVETVPFPIVPDVEILPAEGEDTAVSGSCGDEVNWTYADGTLTISGSGAMDDLDYEALPWNDYISSVTAIVIEEGVTTIGDNAFCMFANLTSVTLPSSLTSIGSSAFADCSSLTSISIPGSVTSIGGGAFAGCTLLDGVQLPAHITAINYLLFQDCSSLTSIIIPEGVTSIDFGAFRNCTSLRFVYIPASVTTIDANGMTYAPFYGCSAGLRIYCGASSALSSWDTYSFLLSNSSYTTPFYGHSLLDATYWPTLDTTETSVEVPEGITFLPNGAFSGCTNLTSVTLPSTLTGINDYAFSGCTALTSVYIPEGVTRIGEGAFQNCTALESVYIPSTVTFIRAASYNSSPFYGCSSSLKIYCGASSKGSNWGTYWNNYASGSSLSVTYNYKAINFTYWNNLDESASVIRIPDDVTVIPNKAFENCTNLMEVYIPASVTSIPAGSSSGSPFVGRSSDLVIYCETASRPSGWGTYWNYNVAGGTSSKLTTCWGFSQSDYNYWKSVDSSAAVLSIPDSVTRIPPIAFSGWQNLKAVYIPASVTKIHSTYSGVYPFTNCSTDLMVFCETESKPSGWNSSWNGSVSHPVFGSSRDEFTLFSQIDKTQSSITIPYGITRIPAYMFYQNQTLKKLVLPETVTTIEDFAFCQCSALESVTLPGSLTTIGTSAFATCSSLCSVIIPSGVVSIGNNAFRYTGLDTVFIPKTVTTIGSYPWPTANTMVVYCEAESAQDGWGSNWSSNATVCYGFSAEDYAYWGAFDRNSTSVVIDDGVTMIPDNAFINFTNMTSVTIPDSVTSIGRNAFAGCTGLSTIFLPASVTSISAADPSESPFYNLGYLRIYCEAESAPAGWETYWNYYKTDYVIPAEYGFSRQEYDFFTTLDKTATSIVIPDGMRFIPQLAFEGCANLKSVYIPASVTTISVPSISEAPFLGLSDLVIYCAADSKPEGWDSLWNRYSAFSSSSLLSRFGCTLSDYNFWSNLDTSAAHIGIPDGITIIPTRAFRNCTTLTSIDIPDSVTTIGDSAFSGCTSLTSIDLPDTVTAIGGGAFGGCTGLTSVEIPETVASIEDYTFQGCTGLASFTIPAGVTSLGSRAFDGCTGITALYIPKTVETIAAYLFSYSDTTTPVVTVYCEAETAPAGWQTEWDNGCAVSFGCTTETFDYWTKQEHTGEVIEIPAGITAIPENAFQNNTALKSVVIPESVTSIGANAFAGCSGLESVTIPGSVTAIGENAFKDCAGLTSVTFCEGLESIGVSAFQGCTGLTKVVLPEGLLSIAQNSFRNCTSLASVYIPASVTTISIRNGTSYSPFYECSSLGTIYCGAATTPSGWGTYWNYISSARATVKYGWTNADYHFWTTVDKSEEAIEIPAGVTLIPADAFSGCANLKSVTIPDTVTSIENYAFEDCTGLTSIFIPGSVEKMGYRLFDGCVSSLRVYCEADAMGSSWQGSWNSGLSTVPAYGTSRQEYGFWSTVDSSSVTVEIPDYIDNIPFNAFKDFTSLQSVTIPDGVTSIGDSAFYGCTALESIDLPASLLTISDSAFRGCTALTEVVIPDGTTYIGFYAFKGCTALESVYIPASVTELKAGGTSSAPFSDCGYDKLAIYCEAATEPEGWGSYWSVGSKCSYMGSTKQDYDFWCTLDNTEEIIEIPDGITFIPNDAFNGCAGLTGISIPDSVTKIGDRAFEGCTGLTEIALPAGLVSIGNSAFYHCTALEDIEIPGSVTSIGNDTFENCSSLRTVHIPSSVTYIGGSAFNYCNNLTDIYFGHTASDELSILSGAFGTSYVSSITNYYPLTIHVPTIRDINTVLKNYTWSYRTITWDYTASIPVTEILLSEANNTTEIESGLELYFTAALTPADSTSELVWTVDNGGIVKTSDYITGTATIIGTETGMMTVRCESADDNSVFAEYQVNILPPTADVERITVRPDTPFPNEVEVGTTVQMIADIHPGNAAIKDVVWELENGTGTAELDENGMLTALTTGTVTIFATATDGTEVVGSATINIVRYVDDIVLLFNGDPEKTEIGVGETVKVTFEHFPEDSSVNTVTWKMFNGTGSMTRDSYGNTYLYITGVTPGTVTVTATANDSQQTSVSMELEVVGEMASYAVKGGNIYYNTVTGAIVDVDDTVTAADIPAKINGTTITSIAPKAFVRKDSWGSIINNTTLTSVTIPSTVTYIGDRAFYYCTGLASLRLGSSVTTIGAEAFYYCQSLANLTIPESVTSVGKDAFYGANSLKNLTIPGDLDTRGWLYDYWNNVLETVTLTGDRVIGITPDNIHVNGSEVSMSGWDTMPGRNAKHVIISDSVTSIDSYAFLDCGKIEKVTMGTGVTSIGDLAFYWCNSLRELNLPEGLTHVGKQAFGGVAASLFDMSKIPDSITQQDFPLTDDLVVVPEILIRAAEGKVNFYWHVWEIEGETGSAGIAHYSVDDRRLVIYEPGKVELVCIDEYTGARGSKIINCELGLEIEGLYNNYLTSGEKVTLTARRMPAGTEESVTWSLRAQDKDYASLSATSGKSTTLTAKKVTQATQIQVTATSDDPNDAPETRTIWILPETATITITDAATGEVLGKTGTTVKTIPVDLRTGTMTLSGTVTPEDASEHVFWGTSNYNIAEVDYDGVITFKMPGTATITAFASDTSGKTASFKLQVYYVDPAEKLTASADVPTYGLEVLDSVPIHVFGTDKQNPLNPADLTYYIPDEQLEIATIDEETGILTAGEKTGTVTVTAAIKGDPLARSVSIKVKVIPAQTASVFLTTPENDISKVLMLDPNGEVTTDPEQAARYRVYLDKEQMLSGGFAFPVNAAATDSNGNPMLLSATSMKWATTDKRIATVTANSDGTALVTVKAKIDGACVITATSTDLAKVEGMLEIFVRDYAPRLESTSLTMNSNLLSGVTVGLKPAYAAQIESEVEVLEYVKSTKTYNPTDRFDAVYEDGKLRITSADVVKNGTYKLKVCGNVIKEDGIAMPYEKALTLKVSNKLPSVSVKQKAKFNLFYTDSAAPIAITAKNQTIEKVEISGTTSFKVGEFHRETSLADVVFTEEYIDGTAGKLDAKVNVLVYLEGYRVPVKKALTLSTTTAKPAVSLTPASDIVNLTVGSDHVSAFRVFNKTTGEYMDVLPEDVSAPFASVSVDDGLIELALDKDSVAGKKSVSATVTLQESNWMKPIVLTYKITLQNAAPVLKFSATSLKLNRVFTKQTVSTTVSLSQQNMTLGSFTIEPADKKASARTQAAKVLFDIDGNVITARLDQENLPKSGTYTFRVNATLDDGVTALATKTFKVTVGSTVPTVKLKTPTLKLNKKLGKDHAIACSGFSMSKGAGYEFVRFDLPANWSSNDISVRYDETDGMVYATLRHDNALTGKHTIALTPVLRHIETEEVAALPTTVKLTVQVESKTPSVTVTAKGKLDTTLPDSAITYTVKSFSNVPGTPDDISLSGTHGDLFKATLDTSGTKPVVTLKMAEGVKYNPKTTYKVKLDFLISGQTVSKSVSFKVAQTTLKLKSVPTMRLYQFQSSPMTAQITVTVPAGASIEQITLSSKTPYQFRRALGAGNMKVDYLPDGNALVTFNFAHPGYLTYGKSYTVYLDVTPVSTAQTVKKTQLKFTVKSYK